ncbi:thioredoxin domain-containing protein [Candidatus Vesicomyidisocius sp. SY067_SCS001]|uniref:thioredoxin domain-containing protein n=1 Tax=Candidatus Vesicomyidisocius sp. SY067_SCS001 TaxID=2732590 RepID=UPI0016845388|nr:DUF255 domain-containing protein [Candidatus Vesicomyosocius sp. SY067_SCS001]
MNELEQNYIDKGKNYTPRTKYLDKQGRAKFVNHLILTSSPYLLQHAHNPVNWYEFSDEAFDKAKHENKPIFISIGYATCHWCHVMEKESFDNIEVATFLNQYFIAIKVDREIRPDIDNAYMNVSQLLNGSGGWPLNAILLPNGKAFFAGTYFPRNKLLDILAQVQNLWENKENELNKQANKISQTLNQSKATSNQIVNDHIIIKSIEAILNDFDELKGGFGQAPKFPHESTLLLLINEQRRNPSENKLNAITTTLDTMASGGLYDVIGGGFHRYSTDNSWLVPHFEKMLYNQAQLSLVYTHAYTLTKKPLYKRISKKTLDYTLTEMQDTSNGFFSATDADSQNEEGVFFIWSIDELNDIFTQQELEQFKQWFDLSSNTDFKKGHIIRFKNINNINPKDNKIINILLDKLYQIRNKRLSPLTDNKILLSWNALMVQSLLEAGEAFNEGKYTKLGINLANYLHTHFNKNNHLYRVSIDSKLGTLALFEDYAYLSNAYLSVFDQTNDKKWLDRVITLVNVMNEKFWDKQYHGFNINHNTKYLTTNQKEGFDGAIPSTNAIAYKVLTKLSSRIHVDDFKQQATQLLNSFAKQINQNPSNYTSFILGINNQLNEEMNPIQTIYKGHIRIHSRFHNNQLLINLELQPLWHINSNKPLQDSLIATKIINTNTDYWTINHVIYPQDELINLDFTKEKISIYRGKIQIQVALTNNTKQYRPPTLQLTLQGCSNKACLTPKTITIQPN